MTAAIIAKSTPKLARRGQAQGATKAAPTAARLHVICDAARTLLETVPTMHSNADTGTVCGRLAYCAVEKLEQMLLNSEGLMQAHDASAMVQGAIDAKDAETGQVVVLNEAYRHIENFATLLDAFTAGQPEAEGAGAPGVHTPEEPQSHEPVGAVGLASDIARDACFEVHETAKAAGLILAGADVAFDGDRALRGMFMRLKSLSDIIYEAALQSDNVPTDEELTDLRKRLGPVVW